MPTLADLGRMVKAKYPGTYDDMSDDSLGVAVQRKYPGAYDDFTAAPAPDSMASRRVPAETRTTMMGRLPRPTMANFGEASAAALPYAGGMAGGLLGSAVGPLGAVAGAGVGGAGGEALRQLWEHAMSSVDPASGVRGPQSPQEAAGRISRASVEQGAGELVGRGIAEGASRLAVPLARAGIKASATATRRAAKAAGGPEPDFDALAKTMLEDRTPTAARSLAKLREFEAETARRVAASVARGEKVYITEVAQPLIEQSEKSLGRSLTAKERAAVVDRARKVVNDALEEVRGIPQRQSGFTAAEARQAKRVIQDRATPEYNKAARGRRPPSKSEEVATAQGLRSAADRIASTAPSDALTQRQILLHDALSNTEAGFHPTMLQYLLGAGAGAGGFAGHGAGGAAVAAPLAMMLGSPSGMRWSAHAMTDPTVQWLLQQTPRSALFGLDRLNEGNR